jgi:hypothetical protein
MTMPEPRLDVLTVIDAMLTASLSANVSSFPSSDSPQDMHAILSEEVCGHG